MERKILNPTIAEKSSHPAIVAKKPLAADVEPVDRGNDDEEEAPPCQKVINANVTFKRHVRKSRTPIRVSQLG